MDLEKCKDTWLKASNDTERFASLFIIIKFLKASPVTDAEKLELFETIGFKFLKRLLKSDVPTGCPTNILKAVSISILAGFCTLPELAANPKMHSFIPLLNHIILKNITGEDEILVSEAIECLLAMSKHGKCSQLMFDNVFSTLVKVYCSCAFNQENTLVLLMHLLLQTDLRLEEYNYSDLGKLVDTLAEQFNRCHSEKKFERCEQLLYILLMHGSYKISDDIGDNIREALRDILQSKIGTEHREMALKLAGLMVARYGSYWFIEHEDNSRTFFVVLMQVVSVEVKMILDDHAAYDVVGNAFLLTSCYSILERMITTMINNHWLQSKREYVPQLLNSLTMAMESVLSFLKNTSEKYPTISFVASGELDTKETNAEQILLATIRMLGSWLAEETFALQDEVCDILPFVLNVCKEWLQYNENVESDLDPLRFLLPSLCHLSADDASRKVLLENDILGLLLQYLKRFWCHFEVSKTYDCQTPMITICGIMLNIVVTEPNLVQDMDDFFVLLKQLLTALPELTSSHLGLKANFSVLGLLIARLCSNKVKACETSFYRFLSESIKFLWDAFHVEEMGNELKFIVTQEYSQYWKDIEELWFLGMQALPTLLSSMPWIANFMAESGWPVVLIKAFSSVGPKGIEDSVKYTCQALLCPLASISNDVRESLVKHNAIAVCKKHNLSELETILTANV